MTDSGQYRGRFAPSPSGELHFGSLVAAVASYCDAKHNDGQWLLRIDDIDPPREVNGAAAAIARSLESFGFEWDESIIYQRDESDRYRDALHQLCDKAHLYLCTCSRRDLAGLDRYPGNCLPLNLVSAQQQVLNRLATSATSAIRMHTDIDIEFTDRLHGSIKVDFATTPNDPILLRKDGLFAYTLACAVDDANGITHVVRGSDLSDATAHQIALMKFLGANVPSYAHIPIATNHAGQKLSKQTQAAVLDTKNALALLADAWQFLRQTSFEFSTVGEFWNEAIAHWQIETLRDAGPV